jgi:eukaryotic-like serine/threonine-protein kinase
VPDSVSSASDAELRAHIERVLASTYEVDREVGRGGMGIVYRARDRRLKRPVAIKLLPPELAFRSEIRTRFLREAETAAQLSHPNIVPIYSVDEREGLVFFIMGFVDGENIAKRIFEKGPMDPDDVRRAMREVGDALSFAHARNVIHRDIKPDNIILSSEDGRAMVTDFGIARAISEGNDSRLTATGVAIGTPAYMSPEQCAGDREVDGRSDLYSLGVVGYQMLTGVLPFVSSTTPGMLVKHISEAPAPVTQKRPDAPVDLARAVMVLLEKDPADRFPSAQALVTALDTGNVPEPAARTRPRTAPQPAYQEPSWDLSPRPTPQHAPSHDSAAPTPDEMARWNAPPVVSFRRKVAPFVAVNAVLLFISIFGNSDFLGITALWSVYMAFKYARLWSEGYDWRDVFKQPRDRLFFDVAAETLDETRALWDSSKRAEIRERARQNRLSGRSQAGLYERERTSDALPPGSIDAAGAYAGIVRKAASDRSEIHQLVGSLSQSERERVGDVRRSADTLFQKVEGLALTLADLDRHSAPGAMDAINREIDRLEAQANPLDVAASEERIRRLAYLKRQRRSVADVSTRRETAAAKLESCRLALENMRLDLLRLRAGAQSYENITLMAEQAMNLAREVDSAVYVQDELARLRSPAGAGAGARRSS